MQQNKPNASLLGRNKKLKAPTSQQKPYIRQDFVKNNSFTVPAKLPAVKKNIPVFDDGCWGDLNQDSGNNDA